MVRFSGELSAGLLKVTRRFVAEMIFGIQARGSVRLTEVGRALGERISLKKTEERLSRQLGRRDLERRLQRRLIEQASGRIEDDTLLVLDLSDVTKKYAEKMENLGRVRDGSEKELVWGYWTLNIMGSNTKGTKLVPRYGRLFSHVVEGHESENIEIRDAVSEVAEVVGKRGIWVMDRGGDRGYLFKYLLSEKHRFLIRVRADRGLRTAQGKASALELARSSPMLFHETMVKEEAGQERQVHLAFGLRKVRLPDRREELRAFGIPDFRMYALADGIRQYLYGQTRGLKRAFELQDQQLIQPKLFYP